MRRIFPVLLAVILLFTFAGCTQSAQTSAAEWEMQGVWLPYYQLQFAGKNQSEAQSYLRDTFTRIQTAGYNTVFCHLRANADALYPSEYFPWSVYAAGEQGQAPDYDPLALMITEAHALGLQIHAWINPYRISNQSADKDALSAQHVARQWLEDADPQNDQNVLPWGKGLYFNPAVPAVQQLILDGVREIVENYPVDGVHIDDYFYPTTDPAFDAETYQAYLAQADHPLSLEDWRRANVNTLVAGLWQIVHSKGLPFGVSPAAHISNDKTDRNYNEYYADIGHWAQNEGYVDYLAPQLYFGYQYPNEDYQFENLLNKWLALPRQNSVKLYIGLAGYKIDDPDQIGAEEWQTDGGILANQTVDAKKKGANGIILFAYDSLISENPLAVEQMQRLTEVLRNIKDESTK